jgi:two-component system sensor histidine kinase UhpB
MPGWEIGDKPSSSIWLVPRDAERYAELMRRGDDVVGARSGHGKFAALAIRERKPVWLADISQISGLSRLRLAARADLRAAFGFPVSVGDEVVAFAEFFAADARDPDDSLIAAVGSIAAQLARLIERDRAFRTTARLAAIVETATVAIFTRTLEGKILSWNPGAEKMFGHTAAEAVGRHVEFTLPPGRPSNLARNNEILARSAPVAHESDRITRDGRLIDVLVSHSPLRDSAGNIAGASVILQDITALKQAQVAVRESEERFRTIFEYAPSGIAQSDPFDYRFTAVNPAFARMLGYAREEMIGMLLLAVAHPAEPVDIKENRERMLRGELDGVAGEHRLLRKDGSMLWVNRTVVPVRSASGEPRHFIGVYEDITERKAAETALRDYSRRLQVLSRKVLEAQENERASIARELHDQLGQTLSAAKLNLQVFQRRHKDAAFAPSLKDTVDTVDQALQQVRTLALDLRPPQLDDLGLGTTLRSYAERLAKPARLKLHFSAGELPGLPPQIDIACFRVAQGALTNVLRHAQASYVWVTLAVEHGMLCLCVRDDGKGCDLRRAQRQALRGRSMGLLSMEERTALAGGRFSIRSEPAAGMEVHADFPTAVEAPATADEP